MTKDEIVALKLSEGARVEITWRDTIHHSGWMPRDQLRHNIKDAEFVHYSMGYFLCIDHNAVTIFQSYGECGYSVGDSHQVPLECVVAIKKLRA